MPAGQRSRLRRFFPQIGPLALGRRSSRRLIGMAVFEVPGSKSITARALFLAAAARGTTVLRKPLDSDDTAGFAEGLTALGYQLDRTPGQWRIEGRPQGPAV